MSPWKCATNLTAFAQVAFSPWRILPALASRMQPFKIWVWFVRALTILPCNVLSRLGYTALAVSYLLAYSPRLNYDMRQDRLAQLTIAIGGRVVRRVDIMPCLGICALGSLAVAVRPAADPAQTALILGFQELLDNDARKGCQEFFGCVCDLLVDYNFWSAPVLARIIGFNWQRGLYKGPN